MSMELHTYEPTLVATWLTRPDVQTLVDQHAMGALMRLKAGSRIISGVRHELTIGAAVRMTFDELTRRTLAEAARTHQSWADLANVKRSQEALAIPFAMSQHWAQWAATLGSAEIGVFATHVVRALDINYELYESMVNKELNDMYFAGSARPKWPSTGYPTRFQWLEWADAGWPSDWPVHGTEPAGDGR